MSQDDFSAQPSRKPPPLDDENPFRDNPYASPETGSLEGAGSNFPLQRPSGSGMVRQVPVVAILMIVQGALEAVVALMLLIGAVVIPSIIRAGAMQQGGPVGPPPPEEFTWFMTFMYGAFGVVMMVTAGLHVIAGIRNYSYRGRVMGIVALITGMVTTLISCYCAPTAIAVGVYGLVCYMNTEVIQAFELGRRGKTRQEVGDSFGP